MGEKKHKGEISAEEVICDILLIGMAIILALAYILVLILQ